MWIIEVKKKGIERTDDFVYFCRFHASNGLCVLECAKSFKNGFVRDYETKGQALRDAYYFLRCGWCVERVRIRKYWDILEKIYECEEVFLEEKPLKKTKKEIKHSYLESLAGGEEISRGFAILTAKGLKTEWGIGLFAGFFKNKKGVIVQTAYTPTNPLIKVFPKKEQAERVIDFVKKEVNNKADWEIKEVVQNRVPWGKSAVFYVRVL